ncbi:fluoride efflux transporter CrcB [Oscillatoria sp. FACHB-1406]|nr:fluoride efflux transporter CrcB [Oscillatoria sp. FACHB-1406]
MVKGSARFRPIAAISLGAIAGSLSRYYLGLGIANILGTQFPYSTLIVNITGCLMMGFLATILLSKSLRFYPDLRLFLLTGFLGSYTTFSSYELESITLLNEQKLGGFGVYWAGSFLLGFVALKGGIFIARKSLKIKNNTQS